jgi:peptide chain release factor 2
MARELKLSSLENALSDLNIVGSLELKLNQLQKLSKNIELLSYSDPSYISLKKSISNLENETEDLQFVISSIQTIKDLLNIMSSEKEDESILAEIDDLIDVLSKKLENIEIRNLFTETNDLGDCFIEINAGEGGLDSQEWVSILSRMYMLYADRKGFKMTIEDKNEGDHPNCLKAIRLYVKGNLAFGFLKNEKGIHRLVRMSPFNANDKRQTSFAGISVYPVLDDDINIVIQDKDLIIDSCKSSGPGGQHVNKTESAIRIQHLPSGICVKSQVSRSQVQNKELAMKFLKAKLYKLEFENKEKLKHDESKSRIDIARGSQVRNYIFHPYQLVKDLRSDFVTSNIDKILNGDLDEMIKSVLLVLKNQSNFDI